MNAPDVIVARPVTPDNFARFGTVYDLTNDTDPKAIWTAGEGWSDGFTRMPLIEGSGHLGVTRTAAAPWLCAAMERHPGTEEAIFCAAQPIILAVAPASDANAANREDIEAFVIEPGQAVVMRRGVWHDACRGASGPAAYYWMAICGLGESPWVPVAGGPRLVQADPEENT
ncbi:ureidoglycolate lyase [Pararhizobium capsulatum DSM 1112]|uniref:Ureidoglycolate lyase n=1 Tax=Pararhizobium capsulatum DSM 1112 TaxID=1121113 RepID=A0ABU0BVU1_9HYPH|nr:ureidoglycolate lyase [Pararhizobium capsulatum]MDQ0322369.1 ureidoglycolate lyase [Pararhizobium capsulatum DSM 1112]